MSQAEGMSKSNKAARSLERVETLLRLGRNQEAGRVATQLITGDPRNDRAWVLKAQALLSEKKYEQALVAARAASSVAAEAEYPHRLCSIALSHLGRTREAATAAQAAVELAPDNWATHYLHGQTLLAAQSLPEAQAAAERAVALAPKRPEAHVGLGAVAAAQQRRDAAENSLRRALALDPGNAAAQLRLDALGSRPRPKGLGGPAPTTPMAGVAAPARGAASLARRAGRLRFRLASLISAAGALIVVALSTGLLGS